MVFRAWFRPKERTRAPYRRTRLASLGQPQFRPCLELLESRDCPSFLPATDIAVGAAPRGVTTWQANNSGPIALAVANAGDNTVSIIQGNADGTFQAPVTYGVGIAPWAIVAAMDYTAGQVVLVTANAGDNTISVLRGNADGTFQDAVAYRVGISPGAVAVGYLNFDDLLDIAVANAGDNTVSLLLGQPDGTFEFPQAVQVGSAPSAIIFAGLYQPALVVANAGDDTVSVLQRDDGGNLHVTATYAVGSNPQAVAAGYFGGWGNGLAVANAGDNTISILTGNWDGTLSAHVDYAVGAEPSALATYYGPTGFMLLVANASDGTVQQFSVQPDGSLQLTDFVAVGDRPVGLATFPINQGFDIAAVTANESGNSISVLSGPQFTVTTAPVVRAGDPFTAEVAVRNALGEIVTDFVGEVTLRTSDFQAAPLASYSFTTADQGVHRFDNLVLRRAQDEVIGIETAPYTLAGSTRVQVIPRPATRLGLEPDSQFAGVPFWMMLAARDEFDNLDPTYTGTVTFTSSDDSASLPERYTFSPADQGQTWLPVTLRQPGPQTLTVTDGSLTTTWTLEVRPAPPAQVSIAGPERVAAGDPLALTVQVLDANGLPAADFSGTIWFNFSDGQATGPTAYTFTEADRGVHTFDDMVLRTAGVSSIFVSTFADGAGYLWAASSIVVDNLPAAQLNIAAAGPVGAELPATFVLTAQDRYGNIDPAYHGTVTFTSDDVQAQLPESIEFTAADGGRREIRATFSQVGQHLLTVTDDHGLTTSVAVTATPLPAERMVVSLPELVVAGAPFTFTVRFVDALGRDVPNFSGTVTFASDDPQAILPDAYTYSAIDQGAHTFDAPRAFTQAGRHSLIINSTGDTYFTSYESLQVVPAPPTRLEVVGLPAVLPRGTPSEIIVRLFDAFGNRASNYTGTLTFASSDQHAQLPGAYTFTVGPDGDNGQHAFAITLASGAAQSVRFTTDDGLAWEQTNIRAPLDPDIFTGSQLATAIPVTFGPGGTTALTGWLPSGRDVVLYALEMQAGMTVTAVADTQHPASPLNSFLRAFDASGRCLASNDNLVGTDAKLTFQASADGVYYIGVSASGNAAYDPAVAGSGSAGPTAGGFTLSLTAQAAPLLPDLVGTHFSVDETALWGETLTVEYAIENRGGAAAGSFRVDVRLSADNRIDANDWLLTSFVVAPLAAGTGTRGSLAVPLPAAGVGPFAEAGRYFVGFVLDPDNLIAESDERNNDSQTLGNDQAALIVLAPVAESDAGQPVVLPPLAQVAGRLTSGEVDWYALDLSESGRLRAALQATDRPTELALFDAAGRMILESSGGPCGDAGALDLHLAVPAGQSARYWLRVRAADGSAATYQLTSTFQAASARPATISGTNSGLLNGDFNNDGVPDILAWDRFNEYAATVWLGLGDGSLVARGRLELGPTVAVGDFDDDGRLDLLFTSTWPDTALQVALGNGDGTFQSPVRSPLETWPAIMTATTGDFNADGWLDVIRDNFVYLGQGDGTFLRGQHLGEAYIQAAVAADLNGDGWLDLVQSQGFDGYQVAVFLGKGDGTFQTPVLSTADSVFGYVVLQLGDVNGDGWLDLLMTRTSSSGTTTVLLGRGNGAFAPASQIVGSGTLGYVNRDRDRDLDLLGPEAFFAGSGTGQFALGASTFSGSGSLPHLVGDWNQDGILDLAVAASRLDPGTGQDVGSTTILLGAADSTWRSAANAARMPGFASRAVAADLDNDGFIDLLYASGDYNPLSTVRAPAALAALLGHGNGTFSPLASFPIGVFPQLLVPRDFNRDGRLDLVTLNVSYLGNGSTLSVFLGVGDGTFTETQRLDLGATARDIAWGDFNHDDWLDLVIETADQRPDPYGYIRPTVTLTALLGNPDGTFRQSVQWQPRLDRLDDPLSMPNQLVAGDGNGDGQLDLLLTGPHAAILFTGNGDGTFQDQLPSTPGVPAAASFLPPVSGPPQPPGAPPGAPAPQLPLEPGSSIALTGDFNGDGRLDLIARSGTNRWSFLAGNGDGTFQVAQGIAPELDSAGSGAPIGLQMISGDFNHDGRLDLAGTANNGRDVVVMLSNGDGTFERTERFAVNQFVQQLLAVDADRDGRLDLVCLISGGGVLTLLGDQAGHVVPAAEVPPRSLALQLADFNGDGRADALTLTETGDILVRQARAAAPGTFEPARVVNPGKPGRTFAILDSGNGPVLAVVRADADGVDLYRWTRGSFALVQSLPTGAFPALVVAGNFAGSPDGRADDLAVYNALDGRVALFLAQPSGQYLPGGTVAVGAGISALAIAPGIAGSSNLILADRFQGQVAVLLNDGHGRLEMVERLRANDGLFEWVASEKFQAGLETTLLAVGQFTAEGLVDLVAVSRGQIGLLTGQTASRWYDPQVTALTVSAGALAVGKFNNDAFADIAVLDTATNLIHVYLSDGNGEFTKHQAAPVSAGNDATGLAVFDVDGDGQRDLLVSNTFGDVLVLLGNGDGTFRPYQRASRGVALAGADLDGDGHDDFVPSNEALDDVTIQFGGAAPTVFQDRRHGILAPAAVQLADLDGDQTADLIVANSGGNNVLVYLGLGGGHFAAPRSFFAGTTPVAVYVASLDNGTGAPDIVVVNQGSNDVSVLRGQGLGDDWTLTYGPRLKSGGTGPNSALLADVTGDGVKDIVTTNGTSDSVAVLPGLGNGFFNDVNPQFLRTGAGPVQVVVGNFDGRPGLDLISINRLAGDLTFFTNFGSGRSISSGGGATAAIAADFNHDGMSDLLVANQGGVFALLFGDLVGPAIADLLSVAPLDHPSALILAGGEGRSINIYATNEGDDRVFRFTIELGLPPLQSDLAPLQSSQAATVALLMVDEHPFFDFHALDAAGQEPPALEALVVGLKQLPALPGERTAGSEIAKPPEGFSLADLQRWLTALWQDADWSSLSQETLNWLEQLWNSFRGDAKNDWDQWSFLGREAIESVLPFLSSSLPESSSANCVPETPIAGSAVPVMSSQSFCGRDPQHPWLDERALGDFEDKRSIDAVTYLTPLDAFFACSVLPGIYLRTPREPNEDRQRQPCQ